MNLTPNYWWLNMDEKIWDVSKYPIGHREPEETHNKERKRRKEYSYFGQVRPGDLILAYETTPTKKFVAIFKVTRGIHINNTGEEVFEFEIIEKLNRTIGWNHVKYHKVLKNSEPVSVSNRGSLFRLSPIEYNLIIEMIRKVVS